MSRPTRKITPLGDAILHGHDFVLTITRVNRARRQLTDEDIDKVLRAMPHEISVAWYFAFARSIEAMLNTINQGELF